MIMASFEESFRQQSTADIFVITTDPFAQYSPDGVHLTDVAGPR